MKVEKIVEIYEEVCNIMTKYYDDGSSELPELLFCEASYNRRTKMTKSNILASLKTLSSYDSKSKEMIMKGLPIILVYRSNINSHIKYIGLYDNIDIKTNIYRIYFIHELIHYHQLKIDPPYSKYIGKHYKPFEDSTTSQFIHEIEKECVFTIRDVIKRFYNQNEMMKKLWSLEMIDFKRVYLKDYSDDLDSIVNYINEISSN